jgi:hypothetical protein
MTAQTDDLRLDGNALGGALLDLLGPEGTSFLGTCGSCGTRGALARLVVYARCAGLVGRCPACDAVLVAVVEAPDRTWVTLAGLRTLELPHPAG